MKRISWDCKFFTDLNVDELYSILRLRNDVFVVEQSCIFQDADNKDQKCFHLMGTINNHLVAYARIVPAGVSYDHISIGRIATLLKYRGLGVGKALVDQAILQCDLLFGKQTIQIGAQLYLKKFYERFGFRTTSDVYDEDGIPHIQMIRH
jgi:ElaA protein